MPIRKFSPAIIDEETLKQGLSLEALGLWAHVQMKPLGKVDIPGLEAQFAAYDVDALLQELLRAGLLGDGDELPPPEPQADLARWENFDVRDTRATIYVVQVGDAYKVGVTGNIRRRVKEFQTSNSQEVFVIRQQEFDNAIRIAARLHFLLRVHRISGEWFRCSIEDIDAALALVAQKK